ncbi:PREDICTED: fibrinogen-like protein A [Acropora digitifera]|uniref:fibrinogen-like protein A n=1 Tax=Acropora digitifera TaxID=70779 RepID=UPI00077B24F6|nr:PREDICTED: fibrinogen-like protein A [Acropora digitifera]
MIFGLTLARLGFCFCVVDSLVTGQSSLPARDCLELLDRGFNTSGVYNITPDEQGAFPVWCDQETSGGGWVVFQKRIDGTLQFHRGKWSEYKEGFGDLSREFWLGNEKLHRLSYTRSQELLVQLQDSKGDIAHARYSVFSVDSESQKYKLTVGGYSGSAGDDFGIHNGMKFSSIDEDNDLHKDFCGAGWWFHECSSTLLNGEYRNGNGGVFWYRWRQHNLLNKTEMKIRTQKQRPLDQYLSFTGTNAQDFSSLPSVLDFKSLTVSWWMRGPARPSASTVFCLIDIANEEKVLEFSFQDAKNFKLSINSISGAVILNPKSCIEGDIRVDVPA